MNLKQLLILGVLLFIGLACTSQRVRVDMSHVQPVSLQQASDMVGNTLFTSIYKQENIIEKIKPKPVAVDWFVDAYSQEQLEISQQILKYLEVSAKQHKIKQLVQFDRHALKQTKFLIQGSIALEPHPNASLGKLYHLKAVCRNLKTQQIIATADAWLSDTNLNYQPTPEFKDSPVYNLLKNPVNLEAVKTTAEIQALLNDAGQLYAKHDYQQALTLYQEAAAQAKGQVLRTYAGLYITYLRLEQPTAAAQAFNKLLELNFQQSNLLTLKILFKVGSEEFYGDALVQNQYKLWIKNIGQYLQTNERCLVVAGHSSHSGNASFNEELSLKRATTVKTLMETETPTVVGKIKAEGKGFSENLVGSGTDDDRDKLDRRTEFKLSNCPI